MRFLILFMITPFISISQNLLMNGSFEEENICSEYIKNCAPEAWISTSLKSDYYFDDVRHAYDGQHFVGLTFVPDRNRRPHFLRSRLLCGLRAGAQYQLEFYIRSVHGGLDSVGVYFSSDDILYRKTDIRANLPQLWVSENVAATSTSEWQKCSMVYTASGNENFISIGNYGKQEHVYSGRPDLGLDFYFFIDKISLVPLNTNEKMCEGAELLKDQEYEMNARHSMLEKMVYVYTKTPPPVVPSPKTIVQRIDTLVVPDVLFATNSYALNKQAGDLLEAFIGTSKDLIVDSIVVEGHTDSTGSVSFNQKLSENRALSVAAYLQKYFQPSIVIRGLAGEKPIAENRTAAGRQKNRRVEIYMYVRE
jgi:outer membrane protein OmpA-like peptidoglycan-associated protein